MTGAAAPLLPAPAVAGGTAAAPLAGTLATVPLAVAVAGLLAVAARWPYHGGVSWVTGAAGAVSLAATIATLPRPPDDGKRAGTLGLAECAVLLLLIVLAARWAPRRPAIVAVALAGTAESLWVLRFLPSHAVLDVVGACALWSAGPVAAIVVGGYPRLAEVRRLRSVAAARRAQRLALARDLHDFVAHDVSGIVVQAQAARFTADPRQALAALERIEAAGLHALESMDRTVLVLRGMAEEQADTAVPGLADLPELLDRFVGTGSVRVQLDLDRDLVPVVPRAVDAAAYRVVTEALTNIRRHAPAVTTVRAEVRRAPGPGVAVVVTNDNPAGGDQPRLARVGRSGGSGLTGLRERVHLLGGTLTAGACADGWRVAALLPLRGNGSGRGGGSRRGSVFRGGRP